MSLINCKINFDILTNLCYEMIQKQQHLQQHIQNFLNKLLL